MRAVRQYLSLALTILCFGVIYAAWFEAGFAEDSTSSSSRIIASYRVDFGGLDGQKIRLTTVLRGSEYKMRGEGQFSVMGGLLYAWRGSTSSKGRVTDDGPAPATYAFGYDGGGGNQRLHVTFDKGAVTQVSTQPSNQPSLPRCSSNQKSSFKAYSIPPVTAMFLYARSENPDGDLKVCDHTVPVFDGVQRYDLVLDTKAHSEAPKKCLHRVLRLCRCVQSSNSIRFRVIERMILTSGFISQSNEIEVWLVSLPKTGMYVPYGIVLPTSGGYASATSSFFENPNGR